MWSTANNRGRRSATGSNVSRSLSGVFVFCIILVACDDSSPTASKSGARVNRLSAQRDAELTGLTGLAALQGDAATQLARATQGRRLRGGQDDMLRVEAVAPGFAGYFLDADERVVLLQKPGAGVTAATIRRLVDELYVSSPSTVARMLMSTARDAPVRTARFSLSEKL